MRTIRIRQELINVTYLRNGKYTLRRFILSRANRIGRNYERANFDKLPDFTSAEKSFGAPIFETFDAARKYRDELTGGSLFAKVR